MQGRCVLLANNSTNVTNHAGVSLGFNVHRFTPSVAGFYHAQGLSGQVEFAMRRRAELAARARHDRCRRTWTLQHAATVSAHCN